MLYVLTHSNIFIWVKFWLGWKWQTCFATKSFAPSWRWPPSKFSFAWFTCVYKQVRAYLDISCPPNSKELTFCTDLDAPGPRCRQQSCISKTTLIRIEQLSWEKCPTYIMFCTYGPRNVLFFPFILRSSVEHQWAWPNTICSELCILKTLSFVAPWLRQFTGKPKKYNKLIWI